MLSERIIVFPTSEKEDEICDYTWQTVSILSKKNTVIVLYPNELVRLKDLLFRSKKPLYKRNKYIVLLPLQIIPFIRIPFVRKFNQKISLGVYFFFLLLLGFFKNHKKVIIWIFHPQLAWTLDFFPFSTVVYDIIDYFTASDKKNSRKFELWKKKIIDKSKLVTSISHTLQKKYQPFSSTIIRKVPQGFNKSLFTKKIETEQNIDLFKYEKTVGFVGHINERIDWKMILGICLALPDVQFIFVGPINHEQLVSNENKTKDIKNMFSTIPNLHHIHRQPKEKIPIIISKFDICMIPYNTKYLFNKYCYPMKLYEYFYFNKKVLATNILELKRYKEIINCSDLIEDWVSTINLYFSKKEKEPRTKYLSLTNSWENKVKKISTYLLHENE